MTSNVANNMGNTGSSDKRQSGDGTSYVPFPDPLEIVIGRDDDTEAQTTQTQHPATTTTNKKTTTKTTSIRQHLGIFWAMSLPYFRESGEARCLFAFLVVLMLLNSASNIAFSYLARDFWSALGDKDADEFYSVMKRFLIALCLLAPINVLYNFQRKKLAIRWRQWMTERILELYFYNPHRIYYRLEQSGGGDGGGQKGATTPMGTTENNNSDDDTSESTNFVDNPDQRLAEDVRSFTQYSLSLFLTVAISIIDLTAFSIVLYTIEPALFLSIIGFAAFGTLATILLGRDLVKLNFQRLSKEADFRYSLVRIRENAESIAFFRGEATEGREVQRRFDSLLANLYLMIGTQRNLEFFTVSYNYLTWILPVVVIAPQYMEGLVELGVVQQAAAAFGHVLDDLSLIINQFEDLSEFSASIGRLHQFIKAIRDVDPDQGELAPLMGRPPPSDDDENENGAAETFGGGTTDGIFNDTTKNAAMTAKRSVLLHSSSAEQYTTNNNIHKSYIYLKESPPVSDGSSDHGPALSIRNLCLSTPNALSDSNSATTATTSPRRNRQSLITNLDLELKWGQKLLIIGPSGIGKSSLLRAIAGLWKSGSGWIERAHFSNVYFLPQRPYCPLGSLRDQLLYPFHSSSSNNNSPNTQNDFDRLPQQTDDLVLLNILESVDLSDLAKRSGDGDPFLGLDTILDWGNVLSLGEQQRLAFGRILVHKPRLVILDEATSAMDVRAEARMYGLLSNVTYVSVGHRPTLLKYHDTKLTLFKPEDTHHEIDPDGSSSNKGNYTIGTIRSTADGVASEEVDLFFR
jgi:ABC-type uncharacterized transport system fused permease/ATPase subunit